MKDKGHALCAGLGIEDLALELRSLTDGDRAGQSASLQEAARVGRPSGPGERCAGRARQAAQAPDAAMKSMDPLTRCETVEAGFALERPDALVQAATDRCER